MFMRANIKHELSYQDTFLTESYTRLNVKTLKPIKTKKSPPRWR